MYVSIGYKQLNLRDVHVATSYVLSFFICRKILSILPSAIIILYIVSKCN